MNGVRATELPRDAKERQATTANDIGVDYDNSCPAAEFPYADQRAGGFVHDNAGKSSLDWRASAS